MKLRIKGNSIRFRLTRSEVKQMSEGVHLKEQIEFPVPFSYSVEAVDDLNDLSAEFKDNGIALYLPSNWAESWDSSEKVGFESVMQTSNGKEIHLLIEKDFKCLDETTEDQSDNYENPNVNCSIE